jgi:hypothetical protein
VSEWQPISTAPKDGGPLIVYRGRVEVARYIANAANGPYWQNMLGAVLTSWERDNPPTHWMPLPEPPYAS